MPNDPRRPPGGLKEINASGSRPHTPVPPPDTPTAPPPAMPMRPPKQYAAPRGPVVAPPLAAPGLLAPDHSERTLVGIAPPPARDLRESHEISTDSILTELARKVTEVREAKAEAADLRAELEAKEAAAAGADRKALIKLAYRLGGPLVLLMGAATAWLSAHTANVDAKVDRVELNRAQDRVVTSPLPEKVQTAERGAVDCRAWARATDDYYRQVFAKTGVLIPEQPNAPPVKAIETRAPLRKARITGGPVLEIVTPPPPLP